jgi:predicted transcriptional regulator of viral defense system
MKTLTEQVIARSERPFFSRNELDVWLKGSTARRDALLRRAMAAGEIVRIRRGLYMLGPSYQKEKPNPLALAQHVYGPSYISLESALSFHGWIPEAVYTVASVSLNRSKIFETPAGRFEFVRVPQRFFYAGVDRIELSNRSGTVLMASPLKALADWVYVRGFDGTLEDLFGSLRIEAELLGTVTDEQVEELSGNCLSHCVEQFLRQIRTEIEK